jgi:hypothetical protein
MRTVPAALVQTWVEPEGIMMAETRQKGAGRRQGLTSQVNELLQDLGDSSYAVAASLQSMGVTGFRRNSSSCPLARYIHAVTVSDRRVSKVQVDRRVVAITRRHAWISKRVMVVLPTALQEFVVRFDRGDFPMLECRNAESLPSGLTGSGPNG